MIPTEVYDIGNYFTACKMEKFQSKDHSTIAKKLKLNVRKENSFLECLIECIGSLERTYNLPKSYTEYLNTVGKESNLRPIVYEELKGQRKDLYARYFEQDNFSYLVERFKEEDVDSLNDVLPLAASNIFYVAITIIPLVENMPILPILPSSSLLLDFPIFLGYSKLGFLPITQNQYILIFLQVKLDLGLKALFLAAILDCFCLIVKALIFPTKELIRWDLLLHESHDVVEEVAA